MESIAAEYTAGKAQKHKSRSEADSPTKKLQKLSFNTDVSTVINIELAANSQSQPPVTILSSNWIDLLDENVELERANTSNCSHTQSQPGGKEHTLNITAVFEHAGIIINCVQEMSGVDFEEIRVNFIIPHISQLLDTPSDDIVKHYDTTAGIHILLLSSATQALTCLQINEYPVEARTVSSGKTFTLAKFSLAYLDSIIMLGSNFSLLPEIEVKTITNLKSLDDRLSPKDWKVANFGRWSNANMNFATFVCSNSNQKAAIDHINSKLPFGNRHILSDEIITILTAGEKFKYLIIKLSDDFITSLEKQTGLRYAEHKSGIIKQSRSHLFLSELAMKKIFLKLPRRRLDKFSM